MPGGKGSKTQTVQQVNPVQQMQAPFLQDAWTNAQGLYNRFSSTPGSSIAEAGLPWMKEGYQNLYNTGASLDQTLRPQANAFWTTGGGGDIYNSPAYNYFQNMAQNATGPQQQYGVLGGQAGQAGQNFSNAVAGYAPQIAGYAPQIAGYGSQIADMARLAGGNSNLGLSTLGQIAQGQGPGMQQLAATAGGQYINNNPYIAQAIQNALDPITRNFQTSVDPTTNARYAASGRYGSGAMLGERQNNANTLAQNLGTVSQNMMAQNYATERQNQVAAAQQYAGLQNQAGGNYGQLYNQGLGLGMQGLGGAATAQQAAAGTLANAANVQAAAANPYFQGITAQMNALSPQVNAMLAGAQGLQGGYQSGNAAALQAAAMYPQLADAQYSQARNAVAAGQGLNQIQQQYIDEPANLLDRYLKQIGAIQGGSSSTTSPYYTNPLANAMSGITGGLDIMQRLGGMGGLGGAASSAAGGTFADAVLAAGGPPLALGVTPASAAAAGLSGLPAVATTAATGGGLGGILGGIGSIFTGGWIICTELMRQGRMPWRYWAVGSKAFAAYPEVVQRGYYLWAIPVVRHLRRRPQSILSRITAAVFRVRAEDLAARRGVKGARRLLRGRAVTWTLYPLCAAIGAFLPAQDWQQVYRQEDNRV